MQSPMRGAATFALLAAEATAVAWLYASVHEAFGTADAIAMFAAYPAIALVLCGVLFVFALRRAKGGKPSERQQVGVVWSVGAVVGLLGLLFGLLLGPHLAAFYSWFLLTQVVIYVFAYVAVLLRRTNRDA